MVTLLIQRIQTRSENPMHAGGMTASNGEKPSEHTPLDCVTVWFEWRGGSPDIAFVAIFDLRCRLDRVAA